MISEDFVPGLRPGMSNDAYHSARGISKSLLDDMAPPKSPFHFWAKHVDPNRVPEVRTDAVILGDAIHKAVLEPDLLDQHFIRTPADAPKRPSITQLTAKNPSMESRGAIDFWKGFQADHPNKTILKPADMDTVLACRDAVYRHPLAKHLLQGGRAEQSYFAIDPETGAIVKCRLDYDRVVTDGMVIDLKKTPDASPIGFGRSARKFRYDVQGVWYPDVLKAAYGGADVVETFVFIAIEDEWPHAVGIYYLTDEQLQTADGRSFQAADLAMARRKARRDMHKILECQRANEWPDFGMQPQPLLINSQAQHLETV